MTCPVHRHRLLSRAGWSVRSDDKGWRRRQGGVRGSVRALPRTPVRLVSDPAGCGARIPGGWQGRHPPAGTCPWRRGYATAGL